MKLNPEVFKIDVKKTTDEIISFIRTQMHNQNREGIVVPISGGLDSGTVATLCVRAVGKENVVGLMLNEKQGSKEADEYGAKLAKYLGIRTHSIDLTPFIEIMDGYKYLTNENIRNATGIRPFNFSKPVPKGLFRKVIAFVHSRQRLRMMLAAHYAEEHNLLLCGGAHKTEDYTGLFVKFGVDHCCDVMPLMNLFRSHILQIAEYIDVLKEIRDRTPNPDIVEGIVDKYQHFLEIQAPTVDLILYGLEHEMGDKEIAHAVNVKEEKVKQIREIVEQTRHKRIGVMAPSFEFSKIYL